MDQTFQITWHIPDFYNSVGSYIITMATLLNPSNRQIFHSNVSSLSLSLQPETNYSVSLVVRNCAGDSSPVRTVLEIPPGKT